MDITTVTVESILKRLEQITSHLIGTEDYWASKQAETLRQELEFYFEAQRQKDI